MTIALANANALHIPLPDESVHCVVTSPPYFGLRDYGIDGQIGLEQTSDEYVAKLVQVFREVRRVLRPAGTVWLNLGDSYSGYHGNSRVPDDEAPSNKPGYIENIRRSVVDVSGLKPKDLMGMPWRVALALQADGWWLRSDIIWHKTNPMPESVTDRPTKGHEYLFLLAKAERYFYDADAVREKVGEPVRMAASFRNGGVYTSNRSFDNSATAEKETHGDGEPSLSGRNRRTVWTISTRPYSGAHYATFPPDLVEPCIKAGTSERGVCPECAAPWERQVEKPQPPESIRNRGSGAKMDFHSRQVGSGQKLQDWYNENPAVTTGWQPTCDHDTDPVPATVLDPFAGSGTTGVVARALGRNAVLLDLSLDYLRDNARKRLELDRLEAWHSGNGHHDEPEQAPLDGLPLFDGVG